MNTRTFSFTVLSFLAAITASAQRDGKFPFQDTSLRTETRVRDLISRMKLREKTSQLFNQSEPVSRLGIPAYNWWNECLHGVARAGTATVFPQAIGLAASFDEPMMYAVATAISDEARAKHHYFLRNNVRSIYTGLTFWTPNINIFRDPRWGRGQETYGEDPFLTGRMAVNFINGLQGSNPKYFKTIATAKHYAVHSGPEFTRHTDDVFVNDRDLYETYLPAFRAAVTESNVQSVMCAYNRFRDQPCCGSDLLLSTILRNKFGFRGYVVSDCGAITDFYKKQNHHVVETPAQAWGWALSSGTDLNCEEAKSFVEDHLDSAVQNGIINEHDIDVSLTRLFTARFKLGMFDPGDANPYAKIPMSVVGSENHLKLAREAAVKSFVLLKNNGILPLQGKKKIALIGPNADNFAVLISNYNGAPVRPVTPLGALRRKLGPDLIYAAGCPIVPGMLTNYDAVPADILFHDDKGKITGGLIGEYFTDLTFKTPPVIRKTDANVDFAWKKSPVSGTDDEQFAVRWTGYIIPRKSGSYSLKFDVSSAGTTELIINDTLRDAPTLKFKKGNKYKLEIKTVFSSYWWGNCIEPFVKLQWTEASKDYKAEALAAAMKSDVIIFCGGISANLEGEEMKLETEGFSHGDRTSIDLPAVQEALLKELYATGKPVVYVNFSGSAVALNWEHQFLPAILQGFYPGEASGTALVKILWGEENPSARLPVTFYKSAGDLPDFRDYRMEGRTYRYLKSAPLYEFGYGLSYTSFRYSNIFVSPFTTSDTVLVVSASVTNTGKVSGEEVAQVYISHDESSVPVPIRSLAAFKRILLRPDETKRIEFTIKRRGLSVIGTGYDNILLPGKLTVSVGGKQPDAQSVNVGNVVQMQTVITGNAINLSEVADERRKN